MAHIERVLIHRRRVALVRPFVTAVRSADHLDVVLVEVLDSEGRSGWGEAPTSWRVTGESPESVTAAIMGPLHEVLVGRAVDDPTSSSEALERAVMRNSSARMALECAVYDLAARSAQRSLANYLGGAEELVATDMTLSASTDADHDQVVRTAHEHVAEGFTTLKVKVGAGGDDVATLARLRRALGHDVALRIDANQAWSAQQAVRVIASLEQVGLRLDLIEQPVHRDDLDGLAYVRAHVTTPIAADESVWTRRDLREVLEREAADVINIKLAKTGGLREALAMAAEARRQNVGVIVGCMAESHVGIAAGAALAAALDASSGAERIAHDLDGGQWLASSPVCGGVTYQPPHVVLSPEPGTGITSMTSET